MPGAVMSFDPDTVLEGRRVRLRPFEERDLDAAWEMLNEPEGQRLTGTHATLRVSHLAVGSEWAMAPRPRGSWPLMPSAQASIA